MKKIFIALVCLTGLVCSCNQKPLDVVEANVPQEIVLAVGNSSIDMEVESKASAISSVPNSLFWEGTTGTWKSETAKDGWHPSSASSVSSGNLSTGKYQSVPATKYNFYVSNVAITFAAGGSTISASNATDVIAGCTQAATDSRTPSITLEHVFARTATFTCNTQSGYTISNVSWQIESKSGSTGGTGGTYNIATKAWSGVTALSKQSISSSTDLYCTPGVYTIYVTYTLSKGDYSESFTKNGDVTFTAGKRHNITCTAKYGDAKDIVLGVTLTGWGDPVNKELQI